MLGEAGSIWNEDEPRKDISDVSHHQSDRHRFLKNPATSSLEIKSKMLVLKIYILHQKLILRDEWIVFLKIESIR
ncbi:MAG: hypothetical protein JXR48_16030 [Candidatus Delongbacteria bacterium]|nr:hypothetical protein [Candidatus Delongbacteria bacterium]MBN2836467.1 hypothetical protein [Candidatus Delongbacteria bacterium]